jgi:hypothetical protein
MDLETAQRIERLEYQVAMLYRHLGLNGAEEYLPPPPFLPPPSAGPQDAVPVPMPGTFGAPAVPAPTDPRLSPPSSRP